MDKYEARRLRSEIVRSVEPCWLARLWYGLTGQVWRRMEFHSDTSVDVLVMEGNRVREYFRLPPLDYMLARLQDDTPTVPGYPAPAPTPNYRPEPSSAGVEPWMLG